jgi:hypothetical protein
MEQTSVVARLTSRRMLVLKTYFTTGTTSLAVLTLE